MSATGGGLFSEEIDCLLRRMLGDVAPYLLKARASFICNREHGIRWLGVFARDELPDLVAEERPFALVLNTDPKDKPGQHWLALYGPKKGPIELFDSFGQPPSSYQLESLSPTHSRRRFQSLSSSLCGYYCIYFLYLRCWKHSFSEITTLLKNERNPDSWVKRNVEDFQSRFKTQLQCYRTGQCCTPTCSFC